MFVCFSLAKLKELNEGAPREHKLSEEFLENLEMLLGSVWEAGPAMPPPNLQQINMLWKATHWPEGTAPDPGLTKCTYVSMFFSSSLCFSAIQTSCFPSWIF